MLKAEKDDPLPVTEDVVAFVDFLDAELDKALQKAKHTETDYRRLSKLIYSRILIFNRKRIGD